MLTKIKGGGFVGAYAINAALKWWQYTLSTMYLRLNIQECILVHPLVNASHTDFWLTNTTQEVDHKVQISYDSQHDDLFFDDPYFFMSLCLIFSPWNVNKNS